MNNPIEHLWTPLATTPLLWPFVTLSAYVVGCMFQKACGGSPFASPVLVAFFLVAVVVLVTGTSYETFFAGAQFVNFLLGPATIALAIPLAKMSASFARTYRVSALPCLLDPSHRSQAGSASSACLAARTGLRSLLRQRPRPRRLPSRCPSKSAVSHHSPRLSRSSAASLRPLSASNCSTVCKSEIGARMAWPPASREAA